MLACGFWDTHRELSLEFLGERATIGVVGGQASGPLDSSHVYYLPPLPGPRWLCWKSPEKERKTQNSPRIPGGHFLQRNLTWLWGILIPLQA